MFDWFPKIPTPTKTIISKEIGIKCDNSGFFLDTNSDKKLEIKEPNKKKIMNSKKVIAEVKSLFINSSAKKAKCPVTFVVSVFSAKTPVTLTIPATKDNKVAKRKL